MLISAVIMRDTWAVRVRIPLKRLKNSIHGEPVISARGMTLARMTRAATRPDTGHDPPDHPGRRHVARNTGSRTGRNRLGYCPARKSGQLWIDNIHGLADTMKSILFAAALLFPPLAIAGCVLAAVLLVLRVVVRAFH